MLHKISDGPKIRDSGLTKPIRYWCPIHIKYSFLVMVVLKQANLTINLYSSSPSTGTVFFIFVRGLREVKTVIVLKIIMNTKSLL